ncbi:glycoside hydrolase family 3 C-terminal domain-containing protein [Actinoplanes sp. KI2]|uniref:glycoside hydrolase family 3 C-terminal domain-containing protein n=1 Tax=Actinoplanes sp. KI2 TaxID=2983315 RepID=UPI0021D58D3D|nr:glycoside hydrolase family 3 C-terminal domain-containing protein [Actinoplanes sp. KI2]MCU7724397.1 glycoside hydrolase family 3 C-terminal domain-containing protein [Actinoplanes sp. KI2]
MFRSRIATVAAAVLAATALSTAPARAADPPWTDTSLTPAARADLLLAAMTQAEKLTMMHGGGSCGYAGCVPANARLGIPALRLQDGPVGVGDGATGVTQLAAPVAGAASWDTALMRQYGSTLGAEQWGKGTNVVLAPTINIVRDPRWGRAFESFGEDPYLAGQIGAADIQGIQSQGPLAQVKHYAVYNQETARNTAADNAIVSDRAEREIYLPGFETSVKQGGADSVMCSYSAINGPFACENGPLQNQVFKGDWGFDGFITSDWGATHSTVASATNGLDMEMPGNTYYGGALTTAVANGQVSPATIDDHVRRILTPMFRQGLFDRTQNGSLASTVTSAAHTALARQVATDGSVLLKNSNAVLPVPATTRSIAVLGTGGGSAPMYQGGGSAGVNPSGSVSPYQGILNRAGSGISVTYSPGTAGAGITGLAGKCIDVAAANTANGTAVQLYDCNGTNAQAWTTGSDGSLRALGKCMDVTGAGTADGTKIQLYDCNGTGAQKWTATNGTLVNTGSGRCLTAGASANGTQLTLGTCNGSAGQQWKLPTGAGHDQAVAAARAADLAVVFVGKFESEGSDLADINLPADQNQLVTDVAAANPNTVVVVTSGSAVAMPWAGAVRGIIEAWYPGQEYGTALASLLFGDADPSGKLPVTFPASLADVPAHTAAQWPGQNNTVQYSEGIDVGYRWYDRQNRTPAYPFGFGLSYTTFAYADLAVGTPDAAGNVAVSFDVSNTGARTGAEVAQVYVGQPSSTGEPPKNLRGFAKVSLTPGQTQRVTVTLDARSFQYWNGAWATATGANQIMVGASSRDIRLTGSVTVGSTGSAPLSRTGWTATAAPSSTTDVPARMLDGNPGTRWSSGTPMTDGNTVTIDLASPRTFGKVVMDSGGSASDYARGYRIDVSPDASTWQTVGTGTGSTAVVTATIGSRTARYLRITQTGSASSWWSIAELNLYP